MPTRTSTHRMFGRLGCQVEKQSRIAKHICFVPLWAAMGWARLSAWSEKCVKHAMFCCILCIECLGDLGAQWRGEARILQNIYVLLHAWRQGVGQAERLEREMCKTCYVLLHFMRRMFGRLGCQLARRSQSIAKHICFAAFLAPRSGPGETLGARNV